MFLFVKSLLYIIYALNTKKKNKFQVTVIPGQENSIGLY